MGKRQKKRTTWPEGWSGHRGREEAAEKERKMGGGVSQGDEHWK